MRNIKLYGGYLNWLPCFSRCTMLSSFLVLFAGASATQAQTPGPAATASTAKLQEAFSPGWGFGMKFEGSSSGDGTITDLATGVGYNFSHHFGVDLGVPYYFVGTPSLIKQKNPSAVSGNGLGSFGADLKWNFPGKTLNYASTIHLGAPTGDTKKGLSTGHATWNWSNTSSMGGATSRRSSTVERETQFRTRAFFIGHSHPSATTPRSKQGQKWIRALLV